MMQVESKNLTLRERMALRILCMMYLLIAPNQDHDFKNDEAIKFILGEDC